MKTKYINRFMYSVILVVTLTLMACLDSDNLNDILTPEPESLPVGEGLAIGATAPAFSLSDADGNIHALSDYAGKKIALVFFATEG